MAGRALLGCRFVEKDRFGLHHFSQLVTLAAAYVLVCAAQRKRSLLVVEKRRFPLHAVVAFRAARDLPLSELPDLILHVVAWVSGLETQRANPAGR